MHPELIERLVLIGSPPDDGQKDSPVPRTDYIARTLEFSAAGELEALVEILTSRVHPESSTSDIAKGAARHILQLPPESLLSFFDRDDDMDIRPYLAKLDVPVLLTHGTEDRQVDSTAATYLLQRLPNATLYPFEGYGHQPNATAVQEFCHALHQFTRHGRVIEPYRPSPVAA